MSDWFARQNEVELADRDQYRITSRVIECTKFVTGKVMKCVIEFSLTKIV